MGFDPDEPRDDRGRWSTGGAASGTRGEKLAGRAADVASGGSVRAKAIHPAESPATYDELGAFLQDQLHPTKLDADRAIHPLSGFSVKVGQERRLVQPPDHDEGKPVLQVLDYGGVDNKTRPLFPTDKGTEPVTEVFRGMSEAEWTQAQQRGYIQSDQRGTIASWEGTNAALDPRSAAYYLPSGSGGYVAKIAVNPERNWFTIRSDGYLRTRERIPLSDVVRVTPYIRKDASGSVYLPRRG